MSIGNVIYNNDTKKWDITFLKKSIKILKIEQYNDLRFLYCTCENSSKAKIIIKIHFCKL